MPLDLGPARRRSLPTQDAKTVLLMAERYNRASEAMQPWSETAKMCVDYFEGKQWRQADIAKLEEEGRPVLTINKIAPLVRLVLGYHQTNLTDFKFMPGHDGSGAAETAAALTHVAKQISEICQLPHVDSEVFLDGLVTGRAYWDTRLRFADNLLGEVKTTAQDPFATYPDPDGDAYDPNQWSFVMTSKWLDMDEVEFNYGKEALVSIQPWFGSGNFSGMPLGPFEGAEEVTPWRRFGGPEHSEENSWSRTFNGFLDWVDRQRKAVRMIDVQHYRRVMDWFFISLDTGDRVPIPASFRADPAKVQAVIDHAAAKGETIIIKQMPHRRLRHTQMIGDVLVYDDWSIYRTMTIVPFFPYFRRGKTRGMVDDLLGPQDEVNKRRASRIDIIGRMPAGGWLLDRDSTDPKDAAAYETDGSKPGAILYWKSKGGQGQKPEQIMPGIPPTAHQQLEAESEDDIEKIAGVNKAALGEIEAANASGRAVEARQRQTVMGLEPFMANYRRSKELAGRKTLELIQDFYTEPRIVRVLGGSAQQPQVMMINQRTAAGIVNNVSLGKYAVAIDESPLSATYLAATFEELLRLKEMNVPIPDEFIIDASSIGRKDELKQLLAAAREAQAAGLVPPGNGAPPQAGAGDAAGPAGAEPGQPVPTGT